MSKPKVLVIYPDIDVTTSIQTYLAHSYTFVVVHTAKDAIAATNRKKFQIIILELSLPAGHSGLEFLHEFKSYTDTAQVPIILFSMQKLQEDDLKSLGVAAYLYKPKTSLLQLQVTMQKLLAV